MDLTFSITIWIELKVTIPSALVFLFETHLLYSEMFIYHVSLSPQPGNMELFTVWFSIKHSLNVISSGPFVLTDSLYIVKLSLSQI